jgi:hypothetical protein
MPPVPRLQPHALASSSNASSGEHGDACLQAQECSELDSRRARQATAGKPLALSRSGKQACGVEQAGGRRSELTERDGQRAVAAAKPHTRLRAGARSQGNRRLVAP